MALTLLWGTLDRVASWRVVVSSHRALHFSFSIFIGVELFYNVMSISAARQSESTLCLHISPLFWVSFPRGSPESTRVEFPMLHSRFMLVTYPISLVL